MDKDKLGDRFAMWALRSVATAMLFAGVSVLVAGVPLFGMFPEAPVARTIAGFLFQLEWPVRRFRSRRQSYLSRARAPGLPNERATTSEAEQATCRRLVDRAGHRPGDTPGVAAAPPAAVPGRVEPSSRRSRDVRYVARSEREHVWHRPGTAGWCSDPSLVRAGRVVGVCRRIGRPAARCCSREVGDFLASTSCAACCCRRS